MDKLQTKFKGLESHNLFIKFLRLFTLPLLNHLPASFIQFTMKKSSHDASVVVAKGGSTHALEAMYTRYHRSFFSRGFSQGIADFFWHQMISQPKALRNRLTVVRGLLTEELRRIIDVKGKGKDTEPISILSIAGGSSRSLIDSIVNLRNEGLDPKVIVTTLDKDESALAVGAKIASAAQVGECFRWVHGEASDLVSLFARQTFDIVEIVGLLDYLSVDRMKNLLERSKRVMNPSGLLIIANVAPNSEIPFVNKTGWPAMYYRTPEELASILRKSGFSLSDNDIIVEPLGVHSIAVARA